MMRQSAGTPISRAQDDHVPRHHLTRGNASLDRSRITCASGAAIFRSASSARSARYSWMKPSSTANSTMTAMTIASSACPSRPDNESGGEENQDQDVLELRGERVPR